MGNLFTKAYRYRINFEEKTKFHDENISNKRTGATKRNEMFKTLPSLFLLTSKSSSSAQNLL